MKKLFPFLSLVIIGLFLFGMIYSDPFGTRSSNNESTDSKNPVVLTSSIVKYVDDMNGLNDTAGLRARGWIPKRGPLSGPAGTTPNWFQGNNTVFNAFEGPTTGYVAANYNCVTGDNTIDLWLISPVVNGAVNDTISFYERSVAASTFPDSIRVYWASNGDTVPGSGSFVELGRFKTTTTGSWGERRFTLPTAGATGRFAINYRVAHGGPSGANSDYIGVDLVRLLGPAAAPVVCNYPWAVQVSGSTALLYSVKAISSTVGWSAGAGAVVRRTTDGGATWGNGNPNPGVITGDIYNIEALDANTAFVTTSPGATFIYKTTNGGANWVQVYTIAGGFINTIKMVSATNGFAFGDVLAGNWLMLKTVDGGNTWTTLATVAGTGDGRNNCLQILGNDIWFGTGQNTVWHSTNLGVNWTSATVTGITGQITGIQFNTPLIGIVGGATMSKTTDGGATWTLLAALGTGTISGIEGFGDDYWYVRGTGIYRSTNIGVSWTSVHTHTAAQNDIYFATDGNGCLTGWSAGTTGTIAKMTGVPVAVNDPVVQIPTSFKLEQNYPNPFNPTTNITFALPVSGNVELKIYDAIGREVATLVNTFVNAGTHIVPFDASALASGVYIYKINTGSFTDSKKMVLIK
jgi:hypothetical protein